MHKHTSSVENRPLIPFVLQTTVLLINPKVGTIAVTIGSAFILNASISHVPRFTENDKCKLTKQESKVSLPAGTVFVASIISPWAACHGGTHSLTKWSQKILKLIPLRFIHWRWEAGQLIAGGGGGGVVQVPEFVAARWHSYQCPRQGTVNRLIYIWELTVPFIYLSRVATIGLVGTCIDF